jgi:hypothetical protein
MLLLRKERRIFKQADKNTAGGGGAKTPLHEMPESGGHVFYIGEKDIIAHTAFAHIN